MRRIWIARADRERDRLRRPAATAQVTNSTRPCRAGDVQARGSSVASAAGRVGGVDAPRIRFARFANLGDLGGTATQRRPRRQHERAQTKPQEHAVVVRHRHRGVCEARGVACAKHAACTLREVAGNGFANGSCRRTGGLPQQVAMTMRSDTERERTRQYWTRHVPMGLTLWPAVRTEAPEKAMADIMSVSFVGKLRMPESNW
jgi:hypothetical protein